MKMIHCIGFALILSATVSGCKNRLETYEPYDTFDERMAAAETGRPYAPADAYGDQFAATGDDSSSASSRMPQQKSVSASANQNAEVPFSETRGSKHPVNIGAI